MSVGDARVALVTGASSGIGAAVAEKLVTMGMTVVGCGRNISEIETLSAKLEGQPGVLEAMQCDLREEAQILSMFASIHHKHGGVDVCVNNAGLAHTASAAWGRTEHWREMLDVNVLALSICTRETLKSLKERKKDGHIINIGSVMGHVISPSTRSMWYTATKWMVRTLTECLRLELREQGSRTRVTVISPGYVGTNFQLRMLGEDVGRANYAKMELLTSVQVADAVAYAINAAPNMEVNDIILRPTSEKM